MQKELMLIAYEQMMRIRLTEERLAKEYLEKNIRSFVHFYVGQEAVAVGVCLNLNGDDLVFGNHRSHGHYLAKGGNLSKLVAELYGKVTGCSGGKGGSMHIIDRSVGFMGSISILSSVIPIATGAAYSLKSQGKNSICVVFIGDGATEEGGFYESVNLASLLKVPILFVIENNLYAVMSDERARRSEDFDLSKVINGLGAHFFKSNGNNIFDVYNTTKQAVLEIHRTHKPSVIEFKTFRHMAHSGPVFDDKIGYRVEDKLDIRLENCPVTNLKEQMLDMNMVTTDKLVEIEATINKEIDSAIRFAEDSPYPGPEKLMEDVYHE